MKGFKGILSATLNSIMCIVTAIPGCLGILAICVSIAEHNFPVAAILCVPTYACLRVSYVHYCRIYG